MASGKKTIDMTQGGIVLPLLSFILPLIGSSIFQQFYSTADYFFVGNFLSTTSAAAVGASSSLITCTIGLFSGISVGTSIVTAKFIGARQREQANRALHSSLMFAIVVGVILAAAAIFFAPAILAFLKTPASVMPEAILYMRLYLCSMPFMILYNMGAGALRACGDSQTPFQILVVCGFVNIAVDALTVSRMGVAGVALATAVSQGLSAVMILLVLSRKGESPLHFTIRELVVDWGILKQILWIGLPSGLQSILITFSNVVVQYHINHFGETAVAAFATYYKVENFIYLPIMALGQAAVTFTGQNVGAGHYQRIRKGIPTIALIGVGITGVIAAIMLLFYQPIFGFFIKDSAVVANAFRIAAISFPFYWLYPILEVHSGCIRGMGYSVRSMLVILCNIAFLRIVLLQVFSKTIGTLEGLASVYPITWGTAAFCFVLMFSRILHRACKKKSCMG